MKISTNYYIYCNWNFQFIFIFLRIPRTIETTCKEMGDAGKPSQNQ